MKVNEITMTGTVGWMDRFSGPAMVQNRKELSPDAPGDGPDDPVMFTLTSQPV